MSCYPNVVQYNDKYIKDKNITNAWEGLGVHTSVDEELSGSSGSVTCVDANKHITRHIRGAQRISLRKVNLK
jgi:hypothetical protein